MVKWIKDMKKKASDFVTRVTTKCNDKITQYLMNLRRTISEQRGDLPSWVNIVGMIAILVVILILVWSFLPDALKQLVQDYLDKIKNTIV